MRRKKFNRNIVKRLTSAILIITWLLAGWPGFPFVNFPKRIETVEAQGVHMLLFWDGGSAPTGWTIVTTYDGRFPRGEAVSNFGNTGGNAAHTPTTSSVTHSAPSAERSSGANTDRSSSAHTHSVSVTVGPADNLPSFRSLKIIQYDGGIPDTIPSGAIAIFDDDPGMPGSGWTRQSDQDNRMVRVNSSIATGGSDTHQHMLTWSAFGAGSGTAKSGTNNTNVGTLETHTHTAPAATNTTQISALPPYIEVIIAKADSDTSIPAGMIAMFDADPGTGWTVRSGSGGTFYQQFIRGASTFNGTSQGTTSHTHANETSGVSGAATDTTTGFGTGSGTAAASHTHTITASFNSADHTPEYFNVVYAEKDEDALATFTQNDFEWFIDEATVSLTDPWPSGGVDLTENEVFTQLPATKRPLVSGDKIRIQMNITVGTADLSSGSQAFQLEYTASEDCTTAGGWASVGAQGSGTIWRFFDNTSLTDGVTQVNQISTSTTGAEGRYLESNSASWTNPNAVNTTESMEWDFAVENNGAAENTTYCFRMTKNGGTELDTYNSDSYPKLTTAPGTSVQMRHGNFYQNEAERGFFWTD